MKICFHLLIIISILSVFPALGAYKNYISTANRSFKRLKNQGEDPFYSKNFLKSDQRAQKRKDKELNKKLTAKEVLNSTPPIAYQKTTVPTQSSFQWQKDMRDSKSSFFNVQKDIAKKDFEMYKKRLNEPKVRDAVKYEGFARNLLEQKANEAKEEQERLGTHVTDFTGESRTAQDYLIQEEGESPNVYPREEELPVYNVMGEIVPSEELELVDRYGRQILPETEKRSYFEDEILTFINQGFSFDRAVELVKEGNQSSERIIDEAAVELVQLHREGLINLSEHLAPKKVYALSKKSPGWYQKVTNRVTNFFSPTKNQGSTPGGKREYSTSSKPKRTQLEKFTDNFMSRVKKDIKKYFDKSNYDNNTYDLNDLGKHVAESIKKETESFKNVDPQVMEMAAEQVNSELYFLLIWNAEKQRQLGLQLGLYIQQAGGDIAKGMEAYKKYLKYQYNRNKTPYIHALNDLAIDKALKDIESDRLSQFGGTDITGKSETVGDIVSEEEVRNNQPKPISPKDSELPSYDFDGSLVINSKPSVKKSGYFDWLKSRWPWKKK